MPFEFATDKISFENFLMFNAVVPDYSTKKEDTEKVATISVDSPKSVAKFVEMINKNTQ